MKKFFGIGVTLLVAGTLAYLAAIAYLGAFSRYMSDDYCETVATSSSTLQGVISRYEAGNWRAANRYSNLMFVGITESMLGSRSVAVVPVLMVILWGIGLVLLVRQVRKLAGIQWPVLADIFFGGLLAFLSILEAPNRFQVLYWRSSMATHFAPLVFLIFLIAFLLFRFNTKRDATVWLGLGVFLASFIIGGFSEPPVVLMVVGSALSFAYGWFFVRGSPRRSLLVVSGSIFAGALSALVVMAVSPAVAKLGAESPSFVTWVQRTVEYTYFFLLNSIKTLPIPILFNFLASALFFFLYARQSNSNFVSLNTQTGRNIAILLPFLLALFIAAGFSTSAYGQAYPVERARFFAHFLMTITLTVEGALLGIWLSKINLNSAFFDYVCLSLLLLMAFYPLRAVWQVLQEVPEYSTRAEAWDRRDAHIYTLRQNGQTDLIIPQFGGIYGIKELDNLPTHWANRCAAAYYGVNSISAVTIHGEDALEEYYNDPGDQP
ncbi:MAG: hypothetical protein JNM02_11125 [Anaerolineales bacterium]|nr:hypothetical protein [Anaerolineales bacterium]